jgi:hypothetical protein
LGEKVLNIDKKILKLLKAVWAPKRVEVMHCPGHQKGDNSCLGK